MKSFYTFFIAILSISCGAEQQNNNASNTAATTGNMHSSHSAAFNQTFKLALDGYYALKDQFIKENDTAINGTAQRLLLLVDQIKFDSLGVDSAVVTTAKSYADGISAELKGLIGEKNITEKRKAFQMIGEQYYDFIRTVQFDQEVVYHQFCPMAFDNEGAYWLSNSRIIQNPYLPKKMITCGEVRDSIDLRSIKH